MASKTYFSGRTPVAMQLGASYGTIHFAPTRARATKPELVPPEPPRLPSKPLSPIEDTFEGPFGKHPGIDPTASDESLTEASPDGLSVQASASSSQVTLIEHNSRHCGGWLWWIIRACCGWER